MKGTKGSTIAIATLAYPVGSLISLFRNGKLTESMVLWNSIALFVFFTVLTIRKLLLDRRRNEIKKAVGPSYKVIPVKQTPEARFKRFWKPNPWKSRGLLFLSENEIGYISVTNGTKFKAPLKEVSLKWIGAIFKNGGLAWFSLRYRGREQFFTSEGVTVLLSDQKTETIYRIIENRLNNQPNQTSLTTPAAPRPTS